MNKINNFLIILYGPPGSGKSTQGMILEKKLGACRLVMGDIFREIAKTNTSLGKKIKKVIEAGALFDDKMTLMILTSKIRKLKKMDKIIIDGFPRDVGQARAFDKYVSDSLGNKILFIHIRLPRANILDRLAKRRVCVNCNFITRVKKTNKNNRCPKCGGQMMVRYDENKKAIKARLDVYSLQSRLLRQYFRKRVLEVDGNQTISKVSRDLINGIKKYFLKRT